MFPWFWLNSNNYQNEHEHYINLQKKRSNKLKETEDFVKDEFHSGYQTFYDVDVDKQSSDLNSEKKPLLSTQKKEKGAEGKKRRPPKRNQTGKNKQEGSSRRTKRAPKRKQLPKRKILPPKRTRGENPEQRELKYQRNNIQI
jgi:hypothetical protein